MVKYRLPGIGGSSLLFPGSSIGFDSRFQFLTGAKRHYAASGDRNLFAGFWVSPGSFVFVTEIEVSEAGKLDLLPDRKRRSQVFEKRIDELAGLAFVQAKFVEQRLGHVRFRQCHT